MAKRSKYVMRSVSVLVIERILTQLDTIESVLPYMPPDFESGNKKKEVKLTNGQIRRVWRAADIIRENLEGLV